MGFWQRIGRSGKAAVLMAAGFAGGAAAIAVASVPGSDGVISACYQTNTANGLPVTTAANLTIIDKGAGQACTNAFGAANTLKELDWNQSGPAGPAGPTGPQGPAGQNGAPGQTGPQGPPVTVAAGHTLTLSGGQVITVGDAGGVTVNSPALNLRHSVGQVLLNLGGGTKPITFDIAGLNFATGQHGGGGGAGKVAVHDISVTKNVDKASAKLLLFCANGKHIPKVTITMRKAGKVYLTYTLKDVVISSYQTGGSGSADNPSESVSLNFSKIKFDYTAQKQ